MPAEQTAASQYEKGEGMKKQEKIFVIGHKNPDTDSICSAIAYCDIRNRTFQN